MLQESKTSLGAYLREQREEKGLSIDEAAVETNIARKYIEALEKDEYGFFPAEMYVTGFLSSYVEILEIDKEVVLAMYQRAINREREAPLEEVYSLYKSDNQVKKNISLLMIGLMIIIFVIFGIFFFTKSNTTKKNSNSRTRINKIVDNRIIDLNTVELNNEFSVGPYDKISLMRDGIIENAIEFLGYGKAKNQVKFRLGQNNYTYKIGDILNADLNGDRMNDLGLEIVNITKSNIVISFLIQDNLIVENSKGQFDLTPFIKSIANEIEIAPIPKTGFINMKVLASRPVWVGFQVDTEPEKQLFLNTGQMARLRFKNAMSLLLGNSGAAEITFSELTNVIQGGTAGESTYSIFYKKKNDNEVKLYRAQLK